MQVLPEVAESAWYRDVHSGKYLELRKHDPESVAAGRARRREERKRSKAALRLVSAMNGTLAPTRNRRRVA